MNALGKIVAKSKLSEWKGLDRISPTVHQMGCIWREQEKDDVGIDGEIELCRPRGDGDGRIATGKIVKVQSKSGSSFVIRDTDTSFATPVHEKDLRYWREMNLPVVFVVFHPDDDALYWKDIKTYLAARPDALLAPHRIEFDKKADRFDETAYDAMFAICESAPERVSHDVGEDLVTNLLEIVRMPERVWVATVLPEKRSRFRERLSGSQWVPPHVYRAGTVVTFTDPTEGETALSPVVEEASCEAFSLEDWLSQSPENENDLRTLLNSLVHRHLRRLGMETQKKPRRYFFSKGLAQDAPISRRWTSPRTKRTQTRLVAKFYEYGKLRYFRHQALDASVDRFGSKWCVVLKPNLHFTDDGLRASDPNRVRSHMIKARAEQYNDVYRNNVLFWAYTMARGEPEFDLHAGDVPVARVAGEPAATTASFSIRKQPGNSRQKG